MSSSEASSVSKLEKKKKRRPRKALPARSTIAAYWAEQEIEGDPLVEKINYSISGDWGEPSCWACGLGPSLFTPFVQSAEDVDYRDYERSIYKCWNRAKFLERCHIIPDSRGGSNCASNLLLLCKECHKEAPDCANPKFMKIYVINRKSRFLQEYDFVQNFVNQLGIPEAKMNEIVSFCTSEENREKYSRYTYEKTLIGVDRWGISRTKKIAEGVAAMVDFYEISKGKKVLLDI